jgi:hypothetical protein
VRDRDADARDAEVLDAIADWCDEHGWDALDSPEFNKWLKAQGIPRESLMIGKCRMPEGV